MAEQPPDNNNDGKSEMEGQPVQPSPFTTTTDVMNRLNEIMARHHGTPDKDDENGTGTPSFELQRKLPDGSSRKASPSELKAADLETKIKQVAEHVAKLPDDEAKLAFCDEHRQYGNQLYSGQQYEEAIDVYLTCLTAIPNTGTQSRGQHLVFLQVLNNLAQTALQLQWYRKAQEFCRMALEEIHTGADDDDVRHMSVERQLQIVKLYFKRGKAGRHRGEYGQARNDLTAALSVLARMEERCDKESTSSDNDRDWQKTVSSSRQVIRNELQAIQRGVQQGRKNLAKQKQAMQQVLGGDAAKTPPKALVTTHETVSIDTSRTSVHPEKTLYETPRGRQRVYSTLRAPTTTAKKASDDDDDDGTVELPLLLSCWHYYLSVVGRVAETILQWIGDEEEEKAAKVD